MTNRFLYGPIISRRYGRSLGVDLTDGKVCSFNCLFCQIGPTENPTVRRVSEPAAEAVIAELREWMKTGGRTDFVTLCGSGEPTLNRGFGRVLRFVRDETPYKSLLMSNGSLFTEEDVRQDACAADAVKLSLHSWDQNSFERIVRPEASLSFDAVLEGYRRFRSLFRGKLDIEVFIIPGINDLPEQVEKIAACVRRVSPDSVTLNTAVRKPTESSVTASSEEELARLRPYFDFAAERKGRTAKDPLAFSEEAVRSFYRRHPIPEAELAAQFGCGIEQIRRALCGL